MIQKIKNAWALLNRSIYTGTRLKDNLRALTYVSLFTALLGFILLIMDLFSHTTSMLVPSAATMIGGLLCAWLAGVKKDREKAILVPTIFCIVAFTVYTVTGAAKGTAILWCLLLPIGISYFVSVKYGILLSIYYTILFTVIFYTPVRDLVAVHYTPEFMDRFPLIYASMAIFTAIALVQYHRGILLENEYTDRLNAEVAKQTAVAEERSRRIEEMSFQAIQTLVYSIDAKDPYTRGHSSRVSQYSVKIAEALGWDEEKRERLKWAALLHDVGKIGIPDSILNNPRRLTDTEYNIIKSHTVTGSEILKRGHMDPAAEHVARSHHERYDGKGYPDGLAGTEICEEARIAAVADAFDAMSSNRVYRRACDKDHIRNELIKGKGKQFDPQFADIFLKLWDEGKLDEILSQDATDKDGDEPAVSATMEKAVAEFVAAQDEESRLVSDIRKEGTYHGALNVDYEQFAKLYEFSANLKRRFDHPFEMILISLNPEGKETPSEKELERAMFFMDQAVRQNIRDVDILTRYRANQFLVLLIGTESEGAKIAADRIFKGYYKMSGSSSFSPSCILLEKENTDR